MKARFSVMVLVGVCLGIPGLADEFVGPFPSWANVKTMYNAKGDGITDDTAALQAALNAQAPPESPTWSICRRARTRSRPP